ncbi:hypothetical protein RhiirA4_408997 [Rhizophagus irregularis]|uniref:Uncharacterized protein n=1 Tax=Rhizophagus irregularis TaxID=588596 RepID=A0A2I1H3D7_9GLOM|nr:hypothetical protein RhiirA4_408997 [Rhizophagus irregularis]
MEDSEGSNNSDYGEDNIGYELQSLIEELGFIDPLTVMTILILIIKYLLKRNYHYKKLLML